MARELDPCGTIGAYSRHVLAKQTIIDEACHQAWRDYKNQAKPVIVHVTLPRLAGAGCATPRGVKLFADLNEDTVPDARAICHACPVQRTCMQWGVLYEDEGMWGGLTRKELRRERYRHGIRRQEPYSGWAPRVMPAKTRRAAA